jgi:hypothetical protein
MWYGASIIRRWRRKWRLFVLLLQYGVDVQLPPALARWLRDLGEDGAVHVEDRGLLRAEDPEISSSNPALKDLIVRSWPRVKELLAAREALAEINQIRDLAE